MIRKFTLAAASLLLAAALLAPIWANDRYANLAIRMLVAALFASAFNLLWRQARLLSFGHAVYFGSGMFAVIHLMRANEGGLGIPLVLMPLAGFACSLVIGILSGFVATLRSGAYFSMITLALGELIFSLGPRWQGLFGGEAGISTMRMPSMGLSFASLNEVYAIVLFWCAMGFATMWFFGRTPLGQLTYALGDNEQRLRFLGYRTHAVKVVLFSLSAALSGLAGGLLAIAAENADYTIFGPAASAAPVIQTFIGGANLLFGPALGAVLLTGLGNVLSDITRLWPLYQGMAFVAIVLFLPGGIAGSLFDRKRVSPSALLVMLVSVLLCAFAAVFLCESAKVLLSDGYASQRAAQSGAWVSYQLFSIAWSPVSPLTWLLPVGLLAAGGWLAWTINKQELVT